MFSFNEIKDSLLHFIFPHLCEGCGTDLLNRNSCLCIKCISDLPRTSFENFQGNPVEKRFYGRMALLQAAAHLYFTKGSMVSHLVHQVKYNRNKELGIQLGCLMGDALKNSSRFYPDLLIPVPLFPDREKKRGYNQSELLCVGIADRLQVPIQNKAISRPIHTDTQTRKGRIERWKNIEGKFVINAPGIVSGKHVMLVDDVITTGATLESCGNELLKVERLKLSVACLCHAFS